MVFARKVGSLLLNSTRHKWRLARSSKACCAGSIDSPRELSRLTKCGQASAGYVGQVGCAVTVTAVGGGGGAEAGVPVGGKAVTVAGSAT